MLRGQLALEYVVELVDGPAFAPGVVATFLQDDYLKVAQGRSQGSSHGVYGRGIVLPVDGDYRALDSTHDWQELAIAADGGGLWPDASVDLASVFGDAWYG